MTEPIIPGPATPLERGADELDESEVVGELTIPAAARLRRGDLIRILGPRSWVLVEELEEMRREPEPGLRDYWTKGPGSEPIRWPEQAQ